MERRGCWPTCLRDHHTEADRVVYGEQGRQEPKVGLPMKDGLDFGPVPSLGTEDCLSGQLIAAKGRGN